MTDDLRRTLARLKGEVPPAGAFSAAPIPRYPEHYLGVANDGSPCLLVQAQTPVRGDASRRPLRLQGLSIQYNVPCRLAIPQGPTIDRTLTTVLCTTADAMERRYFLHAADLMLRILGPQPTLAAVVSATEHLARMFQVLSQPARRPLTGLIGELLLILRSAAPAEATLAWRSSIDDTYDFAADDVRVEVKAAQGRTRLHYISYDQCHPPRGTVGIFASLFVESSGGGLSLAELVREIEARLVGRQDALMRLNEIVADTLGNSIAAALDERFDRHLAQESLQLFDLNEVPAVRGPLPQGVSHVRFRTDLNPCTPRSIAYFRSLSRTACRLLPEQLL